MDAIFLEALGRVAVYSPLTAVLAVLGWRLLNILERAIVRVCAAVELSAEAYAARQRLRDDIRESGVRDRDHDNIRESGERPRRKRAPPSGSGC